MKKLIIFTVLFSVFFAFASCTMKPQQPDNGSNEEFISDGTITLEWDAPEEAPAGIEYEVYMAAYPAGAQELIDTTDSLEYTYTLPEEGEYKFAVRSRRLVESSQLFSEFLFSDHEGEGDPEPWYVRYYAAEGEPRMIAVE